MRTFIGCGLRTAKSLHSAFYSQNSTGTKKQRPQNGTLSARHGRGKGTVETGYCLLINLEEMTEEAPLVPAVEYLAFPGRAALLLEFI